MFGTTISPHHSQTKILQKRALRIIRDDFAVGKSYEFLISFFLQKIEPLFERRTAIGKTFFKKMCHESNCLNYLLPDKCDPQVLERKKCNTKRAILFGTTEKARTENSAPSKMQGWKTRERKTRHQSAGVEKARTENAAPMCNGGKGENRKRGTKVQGWKRRENVYIVLIFS